MVGKQGSLGRHWTDSALGGGLPRRRLIDRFATFARGALRPRPAPRHLEGSGLTHGILRHHRDHVPDHGLPDAGHPISGWCGQLRLVHRDHRARTSRRRPAGVPMELSTDGPRSRLPNHARGILRRSRVRPGRRRHPARRDHGIRRGQRARLQGPPRVGAGGGL